MSDFAERFFERVSQAVASAGGQKKFEELTGVPQSTISGILTKKVAPSFKSLSAIMDAMDGDSFFPVIKRTGVNSPVEQVKGSGLPTVPVFGSTGAGEPCEFWSQEPERQIEVLPQYAKPGCVALRVDGDSMEPTILKGSYVGVTPLNGSISEGGVYLVNVAPFGRLIKRIRMGEDGSIELVSDNRKYPPRRLSLEQYEAVVVGRVAWVWQEL
jgi:phage repressor protein C with HTH and peptisase S24 domain